MDPASRICVALDADVDQFNLQKHPFYKAWGDGTLPVPALTAYAHDWGGFVRIIDKGWETLGQEVYAQEEREHAMLWEGFAQSLGTTSLHDPTLPALRDLRKNALHLFTTSPAAAAGALYAFEAQQPGTSTSKLEGLRLHYAHLGAADQYFEVHAGDYAEAQFLREYISKMSEKDQAICKEACKATCKAFWPALSALQSAQA